MKKLITISSLILVVQAFPQEEAPESLLRSRPSRALVNEIIELKPVAGHHFNVKAPQKCGSLPLITINPRQFRCQLSEPGTIKITASVCDDAVTFCRNERFDVVVHASERTFKSGAVPWLFRAEAYQPPKAKKTIPGFIMNDPEKALAAARKSGSLLYINFYGIWCPPCNRLEEEVYPKKEFTEATRGLVKAALDADSDISWAWKDRFKIRGYPTVVIADSKLREIGRFVDYRTLVVTVELVSGLQALKNQPIESSQDKRRVGLWHYERGEHDKAIAALKGLPDAESREYLLLARRDKAKREDDAEGLLAALKSLAKDFPDSVRFSSWLIELLGQDRAFAAALVPAARKNTQTWRNSPLLDEAGVNKGDLFANEAEMLEIIGDTGSAKAVYLQAAQTFGEQASQSELALSRGANLERAYYLSKAGKTAQAKALYESLTKTYAEEFTFNYSYANLLFNLKKNAKAYEYAKKAETNSYGDNWLRAVALKAKIEQALGKNKEARATLETGLASAVLPRSTDLSTHYHLTKLRQLLAKLD